MTYFGNPVRNRSCAGGRTVVYYGWQTGETGLYTLEVDMEADNQHPIENYFDFLSPDDIRIKGTRIGIETVLDDYLGGSSPEEIAARYRTLTLEQVYATITYYLHKRKEIDEYLERWRAYTEAAWQEQQRHPPEFVQELRERIQRKRELLVAERGPDYLVTD
jgi:uncharacterized protein (DUF433 family)